MKNIIFAVTFFLILPFQTFAWTLVSDMDVSSGVTGSVTSVNKEVTLYHFSDSLLQAAQNCTPYSEDFAKNNQQMVAMAELAKVFGGNDWKVLIDIKGYNQDNLCHVTVNFEVGALPLSEYDCLISQEQLAELHKTMLDRSTQLITETFTTYAQISDGNGNIQKSPMETTMTDGLFNITWAKISGAACTINHKEPDENSLKDFQDSYNKFSDSFIEDIQNCRPSEEKKSMLFMSETVTIHGMEDKLCKISYSPFELKLPAEKLQEITSLEQIRTLAANTTYSRYIPKYSADGLLIALDNCSRGQKQTSKYGMSQTQGELIQIKQNLTYDYKDNKCSVTFGNKLLINNVEKDYSRTCILTLEDITSLLQPYQQLLEQNREKSEKNSDGSYSFQSGHTNDATEAADKALQEKLFQSGFCSNVE